MNRKLMLEKKHDIISKMESILNSVESEQRAFTEIEEKWLFIFRERT